MSSMAIRVSRSRHQPHLRMWGGTPWISCCPLPRTWLRSRWGSFLHSAAHRFLTALSVLQHHQFTEIRTTTMLRLAA